MENTKNGFLVNPEDTVDLSQKIKIILGNKDINNMKKFCRFFAEAYSWNKLFPKIKKIYEIQ